MSADHRGFNLDRARGKKVNKMAFITTTAVTCACAGQATKSTHTHELLPPFVGKIEIRKPQEEEEKGFLCFSMQYSARVAGLVPSSPSAFRRVPLLSADLVVMHAWAVFRAYLWRQRWRG